MKRLSFACLLLFLRPLRSNSQNQSCISGDLNALQGFLRGLDSGEPGWSINASASGCCSWDGVSCDDSVASGRRVIGLDLQNKSLKGSLADSLADLEYLSWLNLSSNSLQGTVPSGLFRLRQLKRLDLSMNRLSGPIPMDSSYLPSLEVLNVSHNAFTGSQPILAGSTKLVEFDISSNKFSGGVDASICNFSSGIQVLGLSANSFSGDLPVGFGSCASLEELSVDSNDISGNLPNDLFELPSLRRLYLQENQLSGWLSSRIGNLSNLEQLDLSFNSFSGNIPNSFSSLRNLKYLSLQSNSFSGHMPYSLSNLPPLTVLNLKNNSLSGGITLNCTVMNHLSSLDLSSNDLSGPIPYNLSQCVALKTLNLARNNLSGEVPISFKKLASLSYLSLSSNSLSNISSALMILQDVQSLAGLALTRNFLGGERIPMDGIQGFQNIQLLAIASCGLSGSNTNSCDLTIGDILRSTDHFDQSNIVGCGGFGLVYKATLPDGRKVAIKRLSGEFFQMEREFQAEIETLSQAQHKNLVLLQGYCKIGTDRLLIYSYMQNGSLDYWLHEKPDGGSMLQWEKRLGIARGAARGLAYLHQSCNPHILHRDIKSSNILLDENFEAHLADFGLARLILPYDTHITTDLVGTLGYIPPEYGQSSVATFKGDVYSFGVVLLELLTGRRPVDMCKPRWGGRDLVSWVLQMKKEKRAAEVFDPHIYDDETLEVQLMPMLEIACVCLSDSPKLRPLTKQLVVWLDDIGTYDHLPK
ncbi:hypothetical protein B296_00052743 [Ensete ventricosum]|uniref:non-specific serine/threonine protein kinase n=1 Tax=Ensete ventricosum TaxID=4639 RepID=A0A426XGS0_ENSVE|nr:hypothetical protein B296_00052743 [Ensete ventricosum]